MKTTILTWCALIPFIASFGCSESADTKPPPSACPPPHTVAIVTDLNYPQQDCRQAIASAQGQLDGLHYRKACQGADPKAVLPPGVVTARVTDCRTTDGRGVFLDVEVCCQGPVDQALEPKSVMRAEGLRCSIRHTRTRVDELHYPEAESCNAIVSRAEDALGSMHYRNACKAAAPRATRPARVLEARVVECRSGGSSTGVNIDVELCCEAKVFKESDFRELVWGRPPAEVRAALGAPQQITEQVQGVHWSYPIEVAREDRVFPGVTLTFVAGRVNSYSFWTKLQSPGSKTGKRFPRPRAGLSP